jgi:lysozyme
VDTLALVEALCLRFEGLYLRPYICPAGVPTIGVGATLYEDGTRVTLRDPPITRERALELLRWHIRQRFLPATRRLCPGADTVGRLAALIDFAFNLGEGNLRSSTLRRKVNEGLWDEVPAQLLRWNRGAGRVLAGLTKRREAEARLV